MNYVTLVRFIDFLNKLYEQNYYGNWNRQIYILSDID